MPRRRLDLYPGSSARRRGRRCRRSTCGRREGMEGGVNQGGVDRHKCARENVSHSRSDNSAGAGTPRVLVRFPKRQKCIDAHA